MDVNLVKMYESSVNYNQRASSADGKGSTPEDVEGSTRNLDLVKANQTDKAKPSEVDKARLESMTVEMNKFLQLANADLQFSIHEKTQNLMVQVVDLKENKVLKEFPSHEFLDTIARIRDYIGSLVDKKA